MAVIGTLYTFTCVLVDSYLDLRIVDLSLDLDMAVIRLDTNLVFSIVSLCF